MLVLALAPLGGVVPVHLLVAHMPEGGAEPGRAGSGGPVARLADFAKSAKRVRQSCVQGWLI